MTGRGTIPSVDPPSGTSVTVLDRSMEPTLFEGDELTLDAEPTARRPPKVGEIVVVRDPEDDERLLVKRVAAVGGARLWVTRDGVRDARDAGPDDVPPPDSIEQVTLPGGTVFVLSDRRESGRDSRRFGPVSGDRLVGRVVYRTAPAERRGPVE